MPIGTVYGISSEHHWRHWGRFCEKTLGVLRKKNKTIQIRNHLWSSRIKGSNRNYAEVRIIFTYNECSSKTNGHWNLINILLNKLKIFLNSLKITDQMNTSMELKWAGMIRFKGVRRKSSSWFLWSLSMDLHCLAQKKTYWSPFLGPGILSFYAAIFNMLLQTSTQWQAHGHHSSMTQKLENVFSIWMEHLTKHK